MQSGSKFSPSWEDRSHSEPERRKDAQRETSAAEEQRRRHQKLVRQLVAEGCDEQEAEEVLHLMAC